MTMNDDARGYGYPPEPPTEPDEQMPPTQEMPARSYETAVAADEGADSDSLIRELRRLGELVGSTLRAAANTSEAEELRAELREGASALRRELDSTLETTREATKRARQEYSSTGLQRLRSELASALRAVNRALDGLASSVEPEDQAPATDEATAIARMEDAPQ